MKRNCEEIAAFCGQLALLLHGTVGVADGVFLLAEDNPSLGTLLKKIGSQMDAGASFSEAVEKTGAFPGCVVGMIHVGERTGHLETVLEALARFYEQRCRSIRQIRSALGYPLLVFGLMLVVIGILLVKVLPIFDDVYATLGSGLTGVAGGLLRLGQWLDRILPAVLVLLFILVAAALLYGCSEGIRNRVNAWFCDRFGDRGILKAYNNANFARAVALGLAGALPLEEAAEQAGKLLADIPEAANRCRQCARLLREGTPLQKAMEETGFLNSAHSRMLALGLRQGCGDRVMEDITEKLMEQADVALENTVAKIEPAMVLTASFLVGVILLSVMLPLMDIMAVIG